MKNQLNKCHDCGAEPGMVHATGGCDVERCSGCGLQRLSCGCHSDPATDRHDPQFARWTGIWPGKAEADYLGIDLNTLYTSGAYRAVFIKPDPEE